MKELWKWFVTSSADPQKTALTIKGFLSMVAGFAVLVGIEKSSLDPAIEAIGEIILAIYTAVSAIITVVGLLRKFWNLIKSLRIPKP
jgi:hypothetical protein